MVVEVSAGEPDGLNGLLTLCAAIGMNGPYQDKLGGGMGYITQDVEDVEARHAAAPRLYRARTEPCPEASAVTLWAEDRGPPRSVEGGRHEGGGEGQFHGAGLRRRAGLAMTTVAPGVGGHCVEC